MWAGRRAEWPLLTCVLREVSSDVQKASVDKLWVTSRYFIRVEPYPFEFWRIFKLKFPDWIVHAKRYKFNPPSRYTPVFYSVLDLVSWLSDTMKRPGIKGLLLLECTKCLSYQDVEEWVR